VLLYSCPATSSITRYALLAPAPKENLYLAAVYPKSSNDNGIRLTDKKEDACSFVTIEKAAETARLLEDSVGYLASIIEVNN
jgi:hypothetical protein